MADSNHIPQSKADLDRLIAERGAIFSRELAQANARFEERIRELSIVRRVVDALKHIQDARRVFEGILDTIIDETNAENCSLMFLDPQTNGLVVKAARSQTDAATRYYGEENPGGRSFEKGEGIAGQVAESGEPLSILDIATDPRFVEATRGTGPIGSLLCVPLLVDDKVVGVVNMSHPQTRAFTEEDRRLMTLIADQVAIALHNVQLFDRTLQINNVLEKEVQKATEDLRRANEALQDEITERKQASQEWIGQEDESVDVNKVVQEVVQKARSLWKYEPEDRGITNEVITDLRDVPRIRGTEPAFSVILINLIFNALDAMPEGGMITITTETTEKDVQIVVRDTGTGMDEQTCQRIFEPFFTTRTNVAIGLGLSTVYDTVTRWRGTIEVESEPGKGTTFIIQLPAWIEESDISVDDR